MNVAIIPARGGSKRIHRKNIKMFNGQPIIYWSIKAAKESGVFDSIIVSTDDDEIASVAKELGADIPFIRNKKISDDFTGTAEVIKDAIFQISKAGFSPNNVCCIYPTAPLIKSEDISKTLEILVSNINIDFIYPVTEYAHPIHRSMIINKEGAMDFLFPENQLARTQDLPITFHDAGQFYWGTSASWKENKKMHSGKGFKIPNWRVVDIDNEDDWARAELLFQLINFKK
jgi:pseudaminic acid cytidylyltransferase